MTTPQSAAAPAGTVGAVVRPRIVCLCGSTRFYQQFQEANYRETMAGRIVLSVGFYPHAVREMHGEEVGITSDQKRALDALHKQKINLADEVLVLNVGGYVGDSTRGEVFHASITGKLIRWLEGGTCPMCNGRGGRACGFCLGHGWIVADQANAPAQRSEPAAGEG